MSHGYNLLTLERAFALWGLEARVGAGVVIAHPEVGLAGDAQAEAGGYHLTGPTAAVGVARRLGRGRLAFVPELRFTLSRADVRVAGGRASVPNAAFHLALGVEARF